MSDLEQHPTDPDRVDVRDALDELAASVAQARLHAADQIGATNERLDRLVEVVAVLSGEIDAPEPQHPRAWADEATPAEWTSLCDWVDRFMRTYGYTTSDVPACWPAHPGVVEELAALWQSWLGAATSSHAPGDTMAFWHDRSMVPAVTRLRGPFYTDLHGCRSRAGEPGTCKLNRSTRTTYRTLVTLAPAYDDALGDDGFRKAAGDLSEHASSRAGGGFGGGT